MQEEVGKGWWDADLLTEFKQMLAQNQEKRSAD